MSQPLARKWTVEAFFAWQERQADRYELVEGHPVRLMAGAKNVHNTIVINLLSELRDKLRGTPCRPFNSDGSVETLPAQIRRPDAGVDCGRADPDGYKATEPRLVAEVMSPSTRDFDTFEKLGEYKQIESLDYILFVEPNAPEAVLWTRAENRQWDQSRVEGLDASVDLPAIGIALRMTDIYDGVEFPPGPRLVRN